MKFHEALNEMFDVPLADLDGKRFRLGGCDYSNEEILRYGDEFDNASVVSFLLGDMLYVAVEDPTDGYRSALGHFKCRKATKADIKNRFGPIEVVASLKTKSGDYGSEEDCHILQFHTDSGHLVLEVGTGNTNDYYPFFVGNFDADALTKAMKMVNPAAIQAAKRAALPIKGWGDW